MYLILAVTCAFVASLCYVPDFFNTPLLMLTPGNLIQEFLFALFAFLGLTALSHSVEKDGLWPWSEGFRSTLQKLKALL